MDAKHAIKTYLKAYWWVLAILLIALVTYNVLAGWANTSTITPQEAYDHILDQYPGNTGLAEYVLERCEVHGCTIGVDGHVIIRDP